MQRMILSTSAVSVWNVCLDRKKSFVATLSVYNAFKLIIKIVLMHCNAPVAQYSHGYRRSHNAL